MVIESNRDEPIRCAWILALVFFSAFVAHAVCLGISFLSDDYVLLTLIERGGIGAVWSRDTGFLRPLISLSLGLELAVFGMNAPGFHASNMLMHATNSCLVSMIALALTNEGSRRKLVSASSCGLFSGLLFAVLPTNSEAVAGYRAAQTSS